MKKVFKIYKKGVTSDWITILMPIEEITNEKLKFKIDKYISLGYKIEFFK